MQQVVLNAIEKLNDIVKDFPKRERKDASLTPKQKMKFYKH